MAWGFSNLPYPPTCFLPDDLSPLEFQSPTTDFSEEFPAFSDPPPSPSFLWLLPYRSRIVDVGIPYTTASRSCSACCEKCDPADNTMHSCRKRYGQRRRTPIACSRCRKRKTKCSGNPGDGSACQNCQQSGIPPRDCHFSRIGTTSELMWYPPGGLPSVADTPTLLSEHTLPGIDAFLVGTSPYQWLEDDGFNGGSSLMSSVMEAWNPDNYPLGTTSILNDAAVYPAFNTERLDPWFGPSTGRGMEHINSSDDYVDILATDREGSIIPGVQQLSISTTPAVEARDVQAPMASTNNPMPSEAASEDFLEPGNESNELQSGISSPNSLSHEYLTPPGSSDSENHRIAYRDGLTSTRDSLPAPLANHRGRQVLSVPGSTEDDSDADPLSSGQANPNGPQPAAAAYYDEIGFQNYGFRAARTRVSNGQQDDQDDQFEDVLVSGQTYTPLHVGAGANAESGHVETDDLQGVDNTSSSAYETSLVDAPEPKREGPD